MILRILAEAEAEIEAARCYLNWQSLELGSRFLDDLAERLAAIAEDPLRFPKLETLPDDQPYCRALLTVFRYAVVFEVLDNMIVVVGRQTTAHRPRGGIPLRRRSSGIARSRQDTGERRSIPRRHGLCPQPYYGDP